MKNRVKLLLLLAALFVFATASGITVRKNIVIAQTTPSPDPGFDQAAAIAKLREQIKGREQEPASAVFKNIQTALLKTRPAGQLLAVMEMGYSRSLGVSCTHCHVPDKWDSDEKATKSIAREMSAMVLRINGELLKPIKNLKSENPAINCTTCHRGEVKPALNLPQPRS
jgi:hypothetical protein